jgi:preprotein translocase subunit SecA
MNRQELGDAIFEKLKERYDSKEKLIGAEAMRYHERMIMLSVIDAQWKDHLLSMDHLKEGINLRGYGSTIRWSNTSANPSTCSKP